MPSYFGITLSILVILMVKDIKGDDPSFFGTYKLTKSVLFDEYMEAVGVGWWLRLLASAATPTTEISKINDDWSIKTFTTFKTTAINFKLGEEFDETTADGRQCKSTITLDGDSKLKHVLHCGDVMTEIDRVFDSNTMTMYLPFPKDDRVCVRTYAKQ